MTDEPVTTTMSVFSAGFPTTPTAAIEVIPAQPLSGLRIKWLNALIVGATILVWLTLIGGVLVGIGAGVTVASFGGGGSVNFDDLITTEDVTPTTGGDTTTPAPLLDAPSTGHLSQDSVYWIEEDGSRCLSSEADVQADGNFGCP